MQPHKKMFWFPNGVDVEKFNNIVNNQSESKFVLLYAGIIGHAQGLEVILNAAKKLRHMPDICFYIMGDGPEKNRLLKIQEQNKLDNVIFIPNQPTHEVISRISMSHAYIVPLRKLDLFKGAIPSKVFEPLALGVPVLLGVEGEAKDLFIEKAKGGLFFEPENDEMLSKIILRLYNNRDLGYQLGQNGKEFIIQNFRRDVIAESFFEQIKSLNVL
jgi:glycosyltransferase involved in cell wall biosynthesis